MFLRLLLVLVLAATLAPDQPPYALDHKGDTPADSSHVVGNRGLAYDLAYSTYLGGSSYDEIRQIRPQRDGDGGYWIYGVGTGTFPDIDAADGFQSSYNGGSHDVWLIKLAADLTTIECASYLGSSGEDRSAYGLHVFSNNEPVVTGFTDGSSFPTTSGAYDETYNGGDDAFLTRFSEDCNSLTWSTFYGGSALETPRGGIVVDGAGTIYMAGETASSNLPGVSGNYDATQNGSSDAFVATWSSSGMLQEATYVGGSGFDMFSGIAVSGGRVYLDGWSASTNLPATGDANQPSDLGGNDGITAWLPTDLSSLTYLTYRGGSADDFTTVFPTLAPDGDEFYGAGATFSSDYASLVDPNGTGYDRTYNGGIDCGIASHSTSDGSIMWATFLGGSGNDDCERPTADNDGNVLIIGTTSSTDFPVTAGAYDTSHNGGTDVFFAVLSGDGQNLLYSTFIGGSADDKVRGLYYDSTTGDVWLTGTAEAGFPVTPGAYDTTNGGAGDAFILKLVPGATDAPPSEPIGLVADPGDAQVLLTWLDAPDADLAATLVERSATSGSGFSQVQAVEAGTQAWTDTGLENGTTYYYRAQSEDAGGNLSAYTNEVSATPGFVTEAGDDVRDEIGARVQAYPNPFRGRTEIAYSVPENGDVTLAIYDVAGREVERLVSRYVRSGEHRAVWNAEGQPGGTYLCRLTIGEEVHTAQVVLVK